MKTNETGRSMIEMLGVLAIIGVLSVAGIVGYTIAMRKHRANEIAQVISMLTVAAKTANYGVGVTEDTDFSDLIEDAVVPAGVISLKAKGDANGFKKVIALETDDEKLCMAVANIFGTNSTNPLYVSVNSCDSYELTIQTK